MNVTGGKLTRRDWLVVAGLFLVSLALRVPFRSRYAYHWDSAEFSLAVSDYNVSLSQPHPPGYFLYVMLGRLINHFVGDPHTSLVWLSIVFGSALVAMLYLLGMTMFDRRTGWAAALIAMTSSQCWFHSCVALTYVADAFLVCLFVWLCWRAIQRGGSWLDAVLIGGVLAVIGGVRQQTVPGLLPLVLYTFWKFKKPRAAKVIVAGLVTIAGALAWFIPMTQMSGGLATYWEVVRHYSQFLSQHMVARHGREAFLRNVTYVSVFLWIGLLVAALLIAGGLFYRTFKMSVERRQLWDQEHGLAMKFLAMWVFPLLLLTTVIGITDQPGHVFSYLPAFILLAGVIAARIRKQSMFAGVIALVCAVNGLAFLAWPKAWDGVLIGMGRTAQEIQQHDELLGRTFDTIRSQFKPADTLICFANEDFMLGLRQFQLYLPEYDQYLCQLDRAMASPADRPMLSVHRGRLWFTTGPALDGKRQILLVISPPLTLESFSEYADITKAEPVELVDGSENILQTLPVEALRGDIVEQAKRHALNYSRGLTKDSR